MYYIYKKRYIEEKNSLNTKDTKKFGYTKLRLTEDYESESDEEKQTRKKPDKKEPPKKPTSTDMKEFNKLVIKEETGMNRELFKTYFNFQISTAMLKAVYKTHSKKESNDLINVIKSGLSGLKDEIKEMSED